MLLFLTDINDFNIATAMDESDTSKDAKSPPKSSLVSTASKPNREPAEVIKADPETREPSTPGYTTKPIGPESKALSDASTKKREKITTVLEYLKGLGEILFYPHNPDLQEVVITRPMDLMRSLRTVISHKAVDAFKKAEFHHQKLELLQRGLLFYVDFLTINNSR